MKLFMLKSFLIASAMFLCVLFGMQQANEGIHKMKGYDDRGFNNAFTVKPRENGELEASILGNDITSHDLEKKKEQLEEMKAYNFFSSIGKQIAEWFTNVVNNIIKFITEKANE
ncbi:hypothetical protein PB1_15304 [Bacillus methanolicus PB1]|uniref:DUF3679 domain-containing protein n=1 Tax=Bacillus methanolicus PB1 TaxID=997296 RepID=I3DXG6_BACMT|nr:YqxA family protein [Bacillus methanolicus]EIJ78937.1 hypothetical protein PB1_15304 [Bacillus methanolicus PB1]